MQEQFDKILRIEGKPPSQKEVFEKRLNRINEATNWSSGSYLDKDYHGIWKNDEYEVKLGKPGKEAVPEESGYTGTMNRNDMRPDIFSGEENLNLAATFGDVILDLEKIAKQEKYCVELLGALFFRSAFLLDHNPVNIAGETFYRYEPNREVVDYISGAIPNVYENIPIDVFLHYLDAIALNEDVKYHTKGKDLSRVRVGGSNNYLTYVQIIAVITGDMPISTIAKKLLRSGVAAIGINDGMKVIPHLKHE